MLRYYRNCSSYAQVTPHSGGWFWWDEWRVVLCRNHLGLLGCRIFSTEHGKVLYVYVIEFFWLPFRCRFTSVYFQVCVLMIKGILDIWEVLFTCWTDWAMQRWFSYKLLILVHSSLPYFELHDLSLRLLEVAEWNCCPFCSRVRSFPSAVRSISALTLCPSPTFQEASYHHAPQFPVYLFSIIDFYFCFYFWINCTPKDSQSFRRV